MIARRQLGTVDGVSSRPVSHRGVRGALALTTACAGLVLAAACGSSDSSGTSLSTQPLSHSDFFVVTGSHPGFDCSKCHDPAAPSFSAAQKGVDCLSCHASADVTPVHAGVAGFAYDTPTCIGCHKDGTAGALPPNHDSDLFPVTNTKHAGMGCGSCHGATKAVADLKCAPCHDQSTMASKHAAIPTTSRGRLDGKTYTNYAWSSDYCLKCHADGQVNRIAAHPTVLHGLNGDGHAPFCLACHQAYRAAPKTWGVDFTQYTCLACHTDNNGGGGN